MHQPTVSVILPTYNRARLVGRSIESVLRQTYEDFELIVVDDGSTDDSAAILAHYERDPRVRVVRLDRNRGVSTARNAGADAATGKYLAYNDSDDVWHPDKLEKQMRAMLSASDDDYAVCYARRTLIAGSHVRIIPDQPSDQLQGDLYSTLLGKSVVGAGVTVVRRDAYFAVGGWDPEQCRWDDWELALRLAKRYKFIFLDEVLLTSYVSPDSIHGSNDHWPTVRIIRKHLDAYRAHPEMGKLAAAWLWYAGSRLLMQRRTEEAYKALSYALTLEPRLTRRLIVAISHLSPPVVGLAAAVLAKATGRDLLP